MHKLNYTQIKMFCSSKYHYKSEVARYRESENIYKTYRVDP